MTDFFACYSNQHLMSCQCATTASTMHFVFMGSLTCTQHTLWYSAITINVSIWFHYLEKLVEHRCNGVSSPVLLRWWNIYDPCRALLPHCAAEVVHSARGSECLETYVQRTFDDFWSLVFKKINKYTFNITQHIYVSLCYTDEITGWNNQTGVCNRGMHKKIKIFLCNNISWCIWLHSSNHPAAVQ